MRVGATSEFDWWQERVAFPLMCLRHRLGQGAMSLQNVAEGRP